MNSRLFAFAILCAAIVAGKFMSVTLAATPTAPPIAVKGTVRSVEQTVGYRLTGFSDVSEVDDLFKSVSDWERGPKFPIERTYVSQYELSSVFHTHTAKAFVRLAAFPGEPERTRWLHVGTVINVGGRLYVRDISGLNKTLPLAEWTRWLNDPVTMTKKARGALHSDPNTARIALPRPCEITTQSEVEKHLWNWTKTGQRYCGLWFAAEHELAPQLNKGGKPGSFSRATYEGLKDRLEAR
jgi:hypothetical protein